METINIQSTGDKYLISIDKNAILDKDFYLRFLRD